MKSRLLFLLSLLLIASCRTVKPTITPPALPITQTPTQTATMLPTITLTATSTNTVEPATATPTLIPDTATATRLPIMIPLTATPTLAITQTATPIPLLPVTGGSDTILMSSGNVQLVHCSGALFVMPVSQREAVLACFQVKGEAQ